MKGFRQFILKGNVVDLAVAVVIGAAFGSVVSALVKDLLTPLIAAIGGQPDFSGLYFTVNSSRFMYGDFLNAIISFLVISTVVYFFVVLPLTRLLDRLKDKTEGSATRKCPECLNDIPIQARRCGFCTSPITTAAPIQNNPQGIDRGLQLPS